MEQFFDATTDAIVFLDRNYNFTYLNRRANEVIYLHGERTSAPTSTRLSRTRSTRARPTSMSTAAPWTGHPRRVRSLLSRTPQHLALAFRATLPKTASSSSSVTSLRRSKRARLCTEERRRPNASTPRSRPSTAPRPSASLSSTRGLPLSPPQRSSGRLLRSQARAGRRPHTHRNGPDRGTRRALRSGRARRARHQLSSRRQARHRPPDEHRYWTVSYFPVYGRTATSRPSPLPHWKSPSSERPNWLSCRARSSPSSAASPAPSRTRSTTPSNPSPISSTSRSTADTARADPPIHPDRGSRTPPRLRHHLANPRFHKQSTSPQEINLTELVGNVLSVYQGRIANADITSIAATHRKARPLLRRRDPSGPRQSHQQRAGRHPHAAAHSIFAAAKPQLAQRRTRHRRHRRRHRHRHTARDHASSSPSSPPRASPAPASVSGSPRASSTVTAVR